jgi:hypothetical protein
MEVAMKFSVKFGKWRPLVQLLAMMINIVLLIWRWLRQDGPIL